MTSKKKKVVNDDAEKLNKDLDKTNLTKEQIEKNRAKAKQNYNKRYVKNKKKEKEELKKIKNDPELLLKIKQELDKDHIGDNRAKLFVFLTCLSSRLKPSYRFSTAITGDTAEGKTNLWKAIKQHLPDEWYLDLTRVTGSCLEDDVLGYNLLYFGEKSANKNIIEQVKQLVEDGMRILKKDAKTDFKESKNPKQPRKVGLYTTTGSIDDRELNSRYCVTSVHGNSKKYGKVNEYILNCAANIKLEIEKDQRKEKQTWIELYLKNLEFYDIITIPYSPLLKTRNKKSREQRDLKRFLNLIRVLTWLHQHKRISYTYKKYKILISTPEDLWNAMEIGEKIFSQSISEIEPRLQEVIDAYKKLKDKQDTIIEFEDENNNLNWVDRSEIQNFLEIDSTNTIKERIKKLCNMNIFTYKYNKARNRCYIAFKQFKKDNSPINSPINNLLTTYQKKPLYDIIKTNYDMILEKTLIGARQVNLQGADRSTILLNDDLLHIEPTPQFHLSKNVFSDLIGQLEGNKSKKKQKLIGETDRSSKKHDKKQSQKERFNQIKNQIEKDRSANFKTDYDYLFNNFKKEDVEYLIKTNTLVKQGNGEYVIGD